MFDFRLSDCIEESAEMCAGILMPLLKYFYFVILVYSKTVVPIFNALKCCSICVLLFKTFMQTVIINILNINYDM